jgi:rare lipoprotein A (peptidoglycan hydrolase)
MASEVGEGRETQVLGAASVRARTETESEDPVRREPELRALGLEPTAQPTPQTVPPSPTPVPPPPRPSPVPPPAPSPIVVPPPSPGEGVIVGLATWYGWVDGFGPEDTMADGSQFNPDDPTIAAANRWPLGTWLRVCRYDRCIEVQVRDRGAFTHALDLSYAAFAQLAPPSVGVITATITVLR